MFGSQKAVSRRGTRKVPSKLGVCLNFIVEKIVDVLQRYDDCQVIDFMIGFSTFGSQYSSGHLWVTIYVVAYHKCQRLIIKEVLGFLLKKYSAIAIRECLTY